VTSASGDDATIAIGFKSLAANPLFGRKVSLIATAVVVTSSVGRRARDRRGGDVAARPAAIFDHDRAPQPLAQAFADEARQRIGDAARREGNDEGDVACRIRLRARRARPQRAAKRGQSDDDVFENPPVRHISPPSRPIVLVAGSGADGQIVPPNPRLDKVRLASNGSCSRLESEARPCVLAC
jgi:hypothetical protein